MDPGLSASQHKPENSASFGPSSCLFELEHWEKTRGGAGAGLEWHETDMGRLALTSDREMCSQEPSHVLYAHADTCTILPTANQRDRQVSTILQKQTRETDKCLLIHTANVRMDQASLPSFSLTIGTCVFYKYAAESGFSFLAVAEMVFI